jgi:hypothetical protein
MTNVCILYSPVLQNLNSDTKEQYTTSYNTCWGHVRPERLVDKEPYIVGNMLGEYHYLCTLKTSIVGFGKEKEHCSRYKSQTNDYKSFTNVCYITFVSSTPRHSSNPVNILNCGYRHWLTKQIKQTYKTNFCWEITRVKMQKQYCAYFVFYNISHISCICSLLLNESRNLFCMFV